MGIEVKKGGWLLHILTQKAKEELEREVGSSVLKTNKHMRFSMWLTFGVAVLTTVVLILQYCADEKPYDYRPALQKLLQQDSIIELRRIERELEYSKIPIERSGTTNGKDSGTTPTAKPGK